MPDKDKVESLLKLADFSWRDYSERRSIEWKTNFALWLALGTFWGVHVSKSGCCNVWVEAFDYGSPHCYVLCLHVSLEGRS